MADNLRIFGNTYNNAVGVKMTDTNGNEVVYTAGGGDNDIDKLLTNTLTDYESDVSMIREYAFYGNTNLASVKLTGNVSIYGNAFRNCSGLTEFSAPHCTFAYGYAFAGVNCPLAFPSIGQVGTEAFRSYNGTALDFGGDGAWFGSNVFNSASNLNILVLRKSSVMSINGTGMFSGTPFASNGSGGTLYVPQSLISSYQSATNWSTILGYTNNSIQAIEGSIYETQYADGTPIST